MFYLFIIVLLLTWALTWCMRRYALAKQLLDIPNHRSSHVAPTPRGGGVAFVLVFLVSIVCLMSTHKLTWSGGFGLLSALFFTAALGFWDDKKSLPARWRLLGHVLVSAAVLQSVAPIPAISFFYWTIPFGYGLATIIFFYLIWMLNLYNFMDGIDGLAGSEALMVCLSMAVIYWLTGYYASMIILMVLAATMGGFLFWNFPPARIFMGDAGSGFLGLILAIFSLQSTHLNTHFIWSWLILLGFFIVDATVTLLTRFANKKGVFQAHCSHAYQNAARLFSSHLPVTMGVMLINLVWLFPLALLVGLGHINGSIGLLIAYLPVLILVLQFNAGK